jgi:predicted MFS family arabinose efflux permease
LSNLRRNLAAFRLPGFRRLGAAYFVNELGNWLGEVALALVVLELTDSPIATAGLFVAMQFVPALTAPLLVARVDAMPTHRALAALYFGEAAAFCALAALADENTFLLAGVLAIAAADGTIATAARARTRAAAGAILEPAGLLREGNGILNLGFTAGAAAGPAMAGLLIALAGPQIALLADAASFVGVALLLATSRPLSGSATGSPTDDPGAGWFERFRLGITYVRDRPALRALIAAGAVSFVFFALVLPIEVVFAKETLGVGDAGYGLLLAAWGVGMVGGSLLFSYVREASLALLLAAGTLAIGVAYLGTALAPSLAVACLASVVGGSGNGVGWVALITAVQELSAETFQARVLGLLESLASGLSGVGFVLGGAITAIASPRASFAVAGVGVLCVLAVTAVILRGLRWQGQSEAHLAAPTGS